MTGFLLTAKQKLMLCINKRLYRSHWTYWSYRRYWSHGCYRPGKFRCRSRHR